MSPLEEIHARVDRDSRLMHAASALNGYRARLIAVELALQPLADPGEVSMPTPAPMVQVNGDEMDRAVVMLGDDIKRLEGLAARMVRP